MILIEKRFFDIEKAKSKMALQLLEWQNTEGLTTAEYVDFLAGQMRNTLKYVLRHEREEREGQEEN